METVWIKEKQLSSALVRNEAFWKRELEEYPLMWVTAPKTKNAPPPLPDPADINEKWTNVELGIAHAENDLQRTYFAGDALPVHNPWLGPDQFAAWLGCELTLRVSEFTSWVKPLVKDWSQHQRFEIDQENKWWKLYLEMLKASVEAGKGKWVTAYPDLHCGIDAFAAIRGPENFLMDMLTEPDSLVRPMKEMTRLFKYVFDLTSGIILAGGQGTSNWTMGWSDRRFMCVGHNDVSCMISSELFDKFGREDTEACVNFTDACMYHLDGPGQIPHLPMLLEMKKINCVQWVQGAGNPVPTNWLDLLKRIQKSGKTVQVLYLPNHGGDADIRKEIEVLCNELDPYRLFFWIMCNSPEEADFLIEHAKETCRKKRNGR
jgi:hypothetical protein